MLPEGKICFVELKNETGRLSSLQKNKIRELKKLGCDVIVAYSKDDVDRFISCCQEVMAE
ncbi:VRR-NUC domain-containing protein [Aminipila terrae]|uniref:VRR-NUC domain-containing protein n=1 Tax=Aminipila terrae TaxID=2697030 RepID=UPI001FACCF2A|nr:VRR-NUC domain-containing protein [Aminipila terrae]